MVGNGTIKAMRLYYDQQEKLLRRRLTHETDIIEKVEIIRTLRAIKGYRSSLTRFVIEPPKKPGVRIPLDLLPQSDKLRWEKHPFGINEDGDDGDWITVNGTHVQLGEGGAVKNGPPNLKGKSFPSAKSQKKEPKAGSKQTVSQARDAFKKMSRKEQREYLMGVGGYWAQAAISAKAKDLDWISEKYFGDCDSGKRELVPVGEQGSVSEGASVATQQSTQAKAVATEPQAVKKPEPERAQAGHRTNAEYLRSDYRLQEATIAKECGVSAETAGEMYDAIQGYAGQMTFMDIRLAAHSSSEEEYTAKAGPYALSYSDAKDCADKIESYIEKAPVWNGGTLYRSIKVSADEAESIVAAARNGETMDQRGLSSWTSYKITGSSPSSYGTEIVFVTSGTKQGTSISHLSPTDEGEVLISGKARWKASNVYEQNGAIFIECDEQ